MGDIRILVVEDESIVAKDIEIRGFGEDFEQSKVQGENRRVTIIYQEKKQNVTVEKKVEEVFKDKVKASQKGDIIKLPNFYFYNNSAKIVPKSEPILYELLCVMNDNPKLKIEIQGHICCKLVGQEDPVSEARAKTVYKYLLIKGIAIERMSSIGLSNKFPLFKNPQTAKQHEANRRVEIKVVSID